MTNRAKDGNHPGKMPLPLLATLACWAAVMVMGCASGVIEDGEPVARVSQPSDPSNSAPSEEGPAVDDAPANAEETEMPPEEDAGPEGPGGGSATDIPPVQEEPGDEPPVDVPPVEPPADEPPADEPPAEAPPADAPPADEPPAEQPPADQPPDEPPPDEPPADEPPVDEPPLERWVILLAGQSNMVGLGRVDQLAPEDRGPVEDTLIYYNSSVHNHPRGRAWRALEAGFGANEETFGPELGLARTLRARWPDRPLAFIKVAEGGTALHDRWLPGQDLFTLFTSEIQVALDGLEGPKQVIGMVWMQGESDALSGTHAGTYLDHFVQFVFRLRGDLEHYALPMVAGLIRSNGIWPHAEAVRNATERCANGLGQIDVVETDDLSVYDDDPAHYDTQSNLTMGARFADRLANLIQVRGFRPSFGPQGEGGWFYLSVGPQGARLMNYDAQNGRWASDQNAMVGPDFLHPGTDGDDAVLQWLVPFTGEYHIQLEATHIGNGGDGVLLDVVLPDQSQLIPAGTRLLGNGVSGERTLHLSQGQFLIVRVAAGGDVLHDTVAIDVTPTLIRAQ